MKLNIAELLKKKIEVVAFDLTFDLDYLEREDYRVQLKAPLKIKGSATYVNGIVEARGSFSILFEVQCSRCLEMFDNFLEVDFEECFSKSPDDEERYPIEDEMMILDDMVMDNLILSMPIRFICNDECKGLCPTCGKNLNKVECDCEKENINPKFAVLKDLFKQN